MNCPECGGGATVLHPGQDMAGCQAGHWWDPADEIQAEKLPNNRELYAECLGPPRPPALRWRQRAKTYEQAMNFYAEVERQLRERPHVVLPPEVWKVAT